MEGGSYGCRLIQVSLYLCPHQEILKLLYVVETNFKIGRSFVGHLAYINFTLVNLKATC